MEIKVIQNCNIILNKNFHHTTKSDKNILLVYDYSSNNKITNNYFRKLRQTLTQSSIPRIKIFVRNIIS